MLIETAPPSLKEKARGLLLRHGRNTFAWKILNPGMSLWFSGNEEAVIGYQRYGKTRVVAGAPVTHIGLMASAAAEFEEEAAGEGQSVCYFCAEAWLAAALESSRKHRVVLLGAHPVFNPQDWTESLSRKNSVEDLINHARRRELNVAEAPEETVLSNPAYRRCLEEWLDTRRLPPLRFLVDPELPEQPLGLRFFAAAKKDEIAAFAIAAPVPARNGWLIEHIIRGKNATKGTSELLVDQVMTALAREGSTYVTLGLAPLSMRAGLSYGLNPVWLRTVFHWLYSGNGKLYSFRGLDSFKAKFKPASWEPVYAIVNKPRFSPLTLYHVAGAFCRMPPSLFLMTAAARNFFGA